MRNPVRMWIWSKLAWPALEHTGPVATVLALGILSCALPARAAPVSFADFPVVIFCEFSGSTSAYYFSRLSDGKAIYLTPDRQAGVITIDGEAQRIGGERAGTCLDKTLKELRASGQAFDLRK
ncbi:hypothetical protein K32_15950 [Kaistia sp. 32K]|uniref:hypothetical protein n=1 Tax=Kaistia sp. 32K TaxID=2795690 RepID=UPI001916AED3|nr:hypothetical protein [Kaistia sp. 32K]BCP52978.1 hypothetical protein K32_15950 [Kaistia sp. 32K]